MSKTLLLVQHIHFKVPPDFYLYLSFLDFRAFVTFKKQPSQQIHAWSKIEAWNTILLLKKGWTVA